MLAVGDLITWLDFTVRQNKYFYFNFKGHFNIKYEQTDDVLHL